MGTAMREIAAGVFWLPNCLGRREPTGWMHIHAACYLILGPERTLLVDTGHPRCWASIADSLRSLLGDRRLDYVLPTHTEIPHAGNLVRLLDCYPDAGVVGDVRDFHLYHPGIERSLRPLGIGDAVELGEDWRVELVDATIRDLPNTLWARLDPAGVLFVSDGFMLSHHPAGGGDEAVHAPGECVELTSELGWPPDPRRITFVTERSIYWMRFADAGETVRRMRSALAAAPVRLLAPTHSNVISNPDTVLDVMGAAWESIGPA
jgi:hypothetical protein